MVGLAASAAAERPPKPATPPAATYDTVLVTADSAVLRMEGTGELVDITVKKGDRLEFRSETSDGWVVTLFSATSWVLPRKDGKHDPKYEPPRLDLQARRDLYFKLKTAKSKAQAEGGDATERDMLMDAACIDLFRASGQPTAGQREVMVFGLSQGW